MFRNGCVIQAKEEYLTDLKVGDTIFLISKKMGKIFSILTKIEAFAFAKEPVIYIDQRILGLLAEGDFVTVLKHNPSEAMVIYLAISEGYTRVFSGDWTPIARSPLENKVIDYGHSISFIIPWIDDKGKNLPPIAVEGIVASSVPPPPVRIGIGTKIMLTKVSDMKLIQMKDDAYEKQRDRVAILENELNEKTYQLIQSIKQGNYPTRSTKYPFKRTNPQQLFSVVSDSFKGFRVVEQPKEKAFEGGSNNYLGSAVYYAEDATGSISIIDIQVVATEQAGELILSVTAKDELSIFEFLHNYDQKIRSLKSGLEQKAELKIQDCPGCGAQLPLQEVKSDGTVECIYCRKTTILPKSFRY